VKVLLNKGRNGGGGRGRRVAGKRKSGINGAAKGQLKGEDESHCKTGGKKKQENGWGKFER